MNRPTWAMHLYLTAPTLASSNMKLSRKKTNITDDAELLISHGRVHLAIELLQNHLIEAPKDSASTWLFLLDLLAKEGMQNEFEIAANECKKHL